MSGVGICGRKPRSSPENFTVSGIARKMKVCHYRAMKRFPLFIALPLFAVTMSAQSPTPSDGRDIKFEDPLLDKMVGNWRVVRKLGERRPADAPAPAAWVSHPH